MSTRDLRLRTSRGGLLPAEAGRWLAPPPPEEELLLDRVRGPALDIGCGPGRHVVALMRRGISAFGIELTPAAARLARQQGAALMEGSVFDEVPRTGEWRTALLLDGNIGIGGDPVGLLQRVGGLIAADGRVLVELGAPGCDAERQRVRLEVKDASGPWFPWISVASDRIDLPAEKAGLTVDDLWQGADRWFAELVRR
ncbi:MAG: class I SAM-dependent methyltransferase [Actinomycetota bacterium]|nr:class I SAM-dependent methyltransferase [Actinomycetota bacterium]